MLTRSPSDPTPGPRPRVDLALVAILLLALAFRLYRIDFPLVDAHSWRQVTNADIARHFMDGSLNPFTPRVSWGGPEGGVVGMEFPLLQWLTGVMWRLTGESELVARLVATAFSLATVWLMYLVGLRLHSRGAGRTAGAGHHRTARRPSQNNGAPARKITSPTIAIHVSVSRICRPTANRHA